MFLNFFNKPADGVDTEVCCLAALSGGALFGFVVGGLAGTAVAIWVCVDYVQPAFAAIDGISPAGASAIAAALGIFAIVPAAFGVGGGVGAGIAELACCCVGLCCCCGSNSLADDSAAPSPV